MTDRVELLRLMALDANGAMSAAQVAQQLAASGYEADGPRAVAMAAEATACHTMALARLAELLCDMFPKNPEVRDGE